MLDVIQRIVKNKALMLNLRCCVLDVKFTCIVVKIALCSACQNSNRLLIFSIFFCLKLPLKLTITILDCSCLQEEASERVLTMNAVKT